MEAEPTPLSRNGFGTIFLAWIGLGLSLTLNGYASRDGDQAYRLPLLLHQQNPALFRNDPFVQCLDAFNPHTHYLQLLDLASRPFGLSAGLFGLYAATFLLTFLAVDRIALRVWPGVSRVVGLVAAALLFTAKAGNIGTNHLFEPLLLDRMIALGFGWSALAMALDRRPGIQALSALPIGLAAWVHPSFGLQIGLWLAGCWACWAILERRSNLLPNVAWIALALCPGLRGVDSSRLFDGLSAEQFRLLTAYVQSPQHMIPHLWRESQWAAAFCYPVLAGVSLWRRGGTWPVERRRVAIGLGLIVAGLLLAAVVIEGFGDIRVTLVQPFRMATIGRGICLILIAPYVLKLFRGENFTDKARSVWIFVGLTGDWTMVVVTCVEVLVLLERFSFGCSGFVGSAVRTTVRTADPTKENRPGIARSVLNRGIDHPSLLLGIALSIGLIFLARHDTESGHVRLMSAALGLWIVLRIIKGRTLTLDTPRLVRIAAYCWAVPIAAMLVPCVPIAGSKAGRAITQFLNGRCRFGESPTHDMERLAIWCRDHTSPDARFIGPPGPKTFRLWSLRSLAFNRAGSPYHAAGIADWAARFREHVGFEGPFDAFAAAYLKDRQALERGYDRFDARQLADLATRQEADYVITERILALPRTEGEEPLSSDGAGRPRSSPRSALGTSRPVERADSAGMASEQVPSCEGPLQLLHVEGRYAVYRVKSAGTG